MMFIRKFRGFSASSPDYETSDDLPPTPLPPVACGFVGSTQVALQTIVFLLLFSRPDERASNEPTFFLGGFVCILAPGTSPKL